MTVLYLASQSPRRRELLEQIGIAYKLVDPGVNEVRAEGESPRAYVSRLAREKSRAGFERAARLGEVGRDRGSKSYAVLGADTVVIVDQIVLEKPSCAANAREMLTALSAREHQVLTAIAISDADKLEQQLSVSKVTFRALKSAEIDAYLATDEYVGKAGAYAIQGRAAQFIARLDGSYSGVMGLPLFETAQLLIRFGIDPLGVDPR